MAGGGVRGKEWRGEKGVGAANGVHRALGGPRKAPRGRAGAGGGQGRGGRTPPQRRRRPAPGAGGLAGKWLGRVARSAERCSPRGPWLEPARFSLH